MCHFSNPSSSPYLTSNTQNTGYNNIGTKVARLLEEVKLMTQKDPTSKAVVFSQFLGTLNVIGEEMTIRGVAFARVDGMMKQHHRADAINSFTTDPKTKVLLPSMRGKKKMLVLSVNVKLSIGILLVLNS